MVVRRLSVAGGGSVCRGRPRAWELSAGAWRFGWDAGWEGSGDRGGAAVLVELEDVAGEVDERPFAADGIEAAATEAPDVSVVFAIAEDGFDQLGALFVGGVALRGAEQVFHFLGRCEAGWRGAVGVSQFARGASLFVIFGCGDQAVGAGTGEVVL